jgi:hypothetical protein
MKTTNIVPKSLCYAKFRKRDETEDINALCECIPNNFLQLGTGFYGTRYVGHAMKSPCHTPNFHNSNMDAIQVPTELKYSYILQNVK